MAAGKEWGESGRGLFERTIRHFPWATEKNHKTSSAQYLQTHQFWHRLYCTVTGVVTVVNGMNHPTSALRYFMDTDEFGCAGTLGQSAPTNLSLRAVACNSSSANINQFKFTFLLGCVIFQSLIVTGLWAGRPGFDSRESQGFFSSPPRPDRLWCSSSLLPNGYQGIFPWG
jgi:hypothetical protein